MKRQIILASTSPRRKQLLEILSIKFKAVDPGYEEIMQPNLNHEEQVKFLAFGKAKAAAKKFPNAIIIAADTMVSFSGKIMGKPENEKEAFKILKSFSGKTQYIISAVAILDSKTKEIFCRAEKMKVTLKKLSSKEILGYIATKEGRDRAGGYAFQGVGFNLIEKVEGDITVSVGMPMTLVYNGLKRFNVSF
jgi:septum formation protein